MIRLAHSGVPLPAIRRFPSYLTVLDKLRDGGRLVTSGVHLARELDLDPTLVRKDIAYTGLNGRSGVGYEIDLLEEAILKLLGWNNPDRGFLIGAGHLGRALLSYSGFQQRGLEMIAAFDVNPRLIGKKIVGLPILPMEKLEDLTGRLRVSVAVLAIPAEAAQRVTDQLVAAGIAGIWNFAPCSLRVPKGVAVKDEDLGAELAALAGKRGLLRFGGT